MADYALKRGATLYLGGSLSVLEAGTLKQNLTGWLIGAEVRNARDEIIAPATATLTGNQVLITSAASTNWPLGPLKLCVWFTLPDGTVLPANTSYDFQLVK